MKNNARFISSKALAFKRMVIQAATSDEMTLLVQLMYPNIDGNDSM